MIHEMSSYSTKIVTSSILLVICAFFISTYFPSKFNHQYITFNASLIEALPIDGAFGPESFTFGPAGDGPYAGVSDGRIVKWVPHQRRWVDFAFTSPNREECENETTNHEKMEHICGRPLGLRFYEKTGELYIADAYLGLLVVGPNGGQATRVVTEADDIPLGFTNGLDIDQRNGLVYFTDSSTRYQRRDYMSLILTYDRTGRLLKYNPQTKRVTVLLDNLAFPNGVALSNNGESLLLAETTSCKILRLGLGLENGSTPGSPEVLAELPGFPDNIKMNPKGEYWVGLHAKRGEFLKWLLSLHWVGNTIVNLPFNAVKLTQVIVRMKALGLAVKLDGDGNIVHVLEDRSGKLKFISEVVEKDGNLWFGSVILPFAGLYKEYNTTYLK